MHLSIFAYLYYDHINDLFCLLFLLLFFYLSLVLNKNKKLITAPTYCFFASFVLFNHTSMMKRYV